MKIKDKNLNVSVDVYNGACPKRDCYWPRVNQGSYSQGRGYTQAPKKQSYCCGTREAHGCPEGVV